MTAPAKAAPMREDVTQAVEAANYLIDTYRRLWKGKVVRDLAEAEGAWQMAQRRLAHTARPDAGYEDVERVARALQDEETHEGLLVRGHNKEGWEALARAALAAMREGVDRGMVTVPREPTIDMLAAGIEEWSQHDDCERDVLDIWKAMLEAAALSPEQPR